MQYFATLLKPSSLDTLGKRFYQGVRTPVDVDIYEALEGNRRFRRESIGEVAVAPGATGTVVGQSLQPLASQPTSPPNDSKPATKAVRMKAIQVAAESLSVDDESNFTSDGRPSATALTKRLGWQVTSAERDEAMKVFVKVKTPEVAENVRKGGITIRRRPGTAEPKLLDTGERPDLVIEPQTLGENTGSGLDGQAKPRVRSQAELDNGSLDGEGRREVFSASMLRTHDNATLVNRPSSETVVPTVEDEANSFARGGQSNDDTIQSHATTPEQQAASPEQQAATANQQDNSTDGAEKV